MARPGVRIIWLRKLLYKMIMSVDLYMGNKQSNISLYKILKVNSRQDFVLKSVNFHQLAYRIRTEGTVQYAYLFLKTVN